MSLWRRKGSEESEESQQEWPTYDARTEALVWLRSVAEDRGLSRAERQDAFDDAGRYAPTLDEWRQARRIAERRWEMSRERKLAKGQRPPPPMSPTSPRFDGETYGPPRPEPNAGVVSPARGVRLLRALFDIISHGGSVPRISPEPPPEPIRTDPEHADHYWYNVALERKRRAWMVAKGLDYWPRLSIREEDLDRERPS